MLYLNLDFISWNENSKNNSLYEIFISWTIKEVLRFLIWFSISYSLVQSLLSTSFWNSFCINITSFSDIFLLLAFDFSFLKVPVDFASSSLIFILSPILIKSSIPISGVISSILNPKKSSIPNSKIKSKWHQFYIREVACVTRILIKIFTFISRNN